MRQQEVVIMFFSCSGNRACLLARALKVLADSGYQGIKKYHRSSEIPTKSSKRSRWTRRKSGITVRSLRNVLAMNTP
jgi:hypothetical protein